MPEIIRCANCSRETYADLALCPHCKTTLVASPEEPLELRIPEPNIDHASFVAGVNSGRLDVAFVEEKLKSAAFYQHFPKFYAKQMMLEFFGLPVIFISVFTIEFSLKSEIGDTFVFPLLVVAPIVLGIGIYAMWRRSRERMVRKRILSDADFHKTMMAEGFIKVILAEPEDSVQRNR